MDSERTLAISTAFLPFLEQETTAFTLGFKLDREVSVSSPRTDQTQTFAQLEFPSPWKPAASFSGSEREERRDEDVLRLLLAQLTPSLMVSCLVFFRGYCGWRPSPRALPPQLQPTYRTAPFIWGVT